MTQPLCDMLLHCVCVIARGCCCYASSHLRGVNHVSALIEEYIHYIMLMFTLGLNWRDMRYSLFLAH